MARSLLLDTLSGARATYRQLARLNAASAEGRQGIALDLLDGLAEFAAEQLPVIEGVIAGVERAQREAAENAHLPERPRLVAGAFANVAQPHPHTANPHDKAPSEPDPIIA